MENALWSFSVPYGIIMCKIVYELVGHVSALYIKEYNSLKEAQRIEWKNRGFSTFHAIIVSTTTFYLLVVSDLFEGCDDHDSVVFRRSSISDTVLGISVGYFLTDLAMILWLYPALGGKEFILHHGISIYAIALSLSSGAGQFYILLVLFSECTTPLINLRWYLDTAGRKSSKLYIYNGVAMFFSWLIARILLFVYFFTHMYLHFDQVKRVFPLGFYSLLLGSPMLAMMNIYWFWKIFQGLMKTISRKKHV